MGNFNWNLVAFKRRDEVKEGKLYYFVGSLENPFFRKWGGGGHTKNNIYIGGTCLKGGLGEFADLRERVWQKRALHFMQIISSHQAEFSYLAFFELV